MFDCVLIYIRINMQIDKQKLDEIVKAYYEGNCNSKLMENKIISLMSPLVDGVTSKYKKFANYEDLKQDAYEALISSMKTFRPGKGDFIWWASKYIKTIVSRRANRHSTIKIPLKKARTLIPYKTSTMPIIIDLNTPENSYDTQEELKILKESIKKLDKNEQQIMSMYFDVFSNSTKTMAEISKIMKLSRSAVASIVDTATEKLKLSISELDS